MDAFVCATVLCLCVSLVSAQLWVYRQPVGADVLGSPFVLRRIGCGNCLIREEQAPPLRVRANWQFAVHQAFSSGRRWQPKADG